MSQPVAYVPFTHQEIQELMEATNCVDWENEDFHSAKKKLEAANTQFENAGKQA